MFQGSLSNTDYLAFNLTSWETSSETQGIGVTTRDVVSTQTKVEGVEGPRSAASPFINRELKK